MALWFLLFPSYLVSLTLEHLMVNFLLRRYEDGASQPLEYPALEIKYFSQCGNGKKNTETI